MAERLYDKAKQAMEKAYVPYSKFSVGAAVQTAKGNIYTGCNIENSSYSLTCCAERVAIFQAIQAGEREFSKLAVVGNTDQPIAPCGACRQVMAEFFTNEVAIFLYNRTGEKQLVHMSQLLPNAFRL